MRALIRKVFQNQFVRFAIVGVVATAIHYGIYYLLQAVMNVNIAYTLGYLISFIVNFYLSAYFTFKSAPSWGKLAGMGGAHIVNYILHMLFLNLFLWLGVPKKIAPIPVYAIVVPINFLLVRFVFKPKTKEDGSI